MIYTNKIHELLYSLPPGEVFTISENVSPENRQRFDVIVKEFIGHDSGDSFIIEYH
jgi:hypothetical protein